MNYGWYYNALNGQYEYWVDGVLTKEISEEEYMGLYPEQFPNSGPSMWGEFKSWLWRML